MIVMIMSADSIISILEVKLQRSLSCDQHRDRIITPDKALFLDLKF